MRVAQQEYVKHAKKSTLTISELLDGLKEIDLEPFVSVCELYVTQFADAKEQEKKSGKAGKKRASAFLMYSAENREGVKNVRPSRTNLLHISIKALFAHLLSSTGLMAGVCGQDNPELTLAEQAKKLGAMWKALSPEEQAVYKDKAQAKRDEDEASGEGAAAAMSPQADDDDDA